MINRLFGVVATAAGFALVILGERNPVVVVFGIIIVSIGLGFFVYGNGR